MGVAVGVFDRITLVRSAVSDQLGKAGYTPVASGDPDRCVDVFATAGTDVAIVAVREPADESLIGKVGACRADIKLLVLAMSVSPAAAMALLSEGASGVLDAEAGFDALLGAVTALLAGLVVLCPRGVTAVGASIPTQSLQLHEQQWLRSLVSGITVSQLADEAGYSERSMYRLLHKVYVRLGTRDRDAAIAEAARRRLV
jgi:DNA-binding NarL/FixJ family response regulator